MLSSFVLTIAVATSVPMVRVEVDGPGYFAFITEGRMAYSSKATLKVLEGLLSHSEGAPVFPLVRIPQETREIEVEKNGEIFVTLPSFRARAGRISIAVFNQGDERRSFGSFFVSPDQPSIALPGTLGAGVIRTGDPWASAALATPENRRPLPEPFEPKPVFVLETRPEARLIFEESFESTSERVTLGQIALVEGDPETVAALSKIPIADTPNAGKTRALDKKRILDELKKANIDPTLIDFEMPRRVVVRRKSQSVETGDLVRVALESVRPHFGADAELSASVASAQSIAPPGDLELEVEAVAVMESGATVVVVVLVDGQRYQSRLVKVKASLPRD